MIRIGERMRPLYGEGARPVDDTRPAQGNAGLWYDKFCNTWSAQWRLDASGDGHEKGKASPKLGWIETVTGGSVGDPRLLREASYRVALLTKQLGGRSAVYDAQSRFVTGLGRRHPVENGFAWHPTLGVPYLPGSSLKGLVRAWASANGTSAEECAGLFGPAEGPAAVGRVSFLDAIPLREVRLEADVMTPHFAQWTVTDPPGDWGSPTPVPFLVTAAGTQLLFSIVPAGPPREREAIALDMDRASEWLESALQHSGAGAKTAVGYGRYARNAPATKKHLDEVARRGDEANKALLSKTPLGRWKIVIDSKPEREVYDLALKHLAKEPIADLIDRRAFIEALSAKGFVDAWRRGRPLGAHLDVGVKKLKERAAQIDAALAALKDRAI